MTWWEWLLVSWPVASILVGVLFSGIARVARADARAHLAAAPGDLSASVLTDAHVAALLATDTALPVAPSQPARSVRPRAAAV